MWACCLWFVTLLHVGGSWSSWVFSYGHRLLFGALLLAKISSSSFSVGLQHFGEWEGLLAAQVQAKSGCPLCFVDASERGVSPRLEVGGVSLFCAGFALSRLRLICFEARLSGYCVREGGGQGSQPWVLVLAFSRGSGKTSAGRGLLHGHVDFGL